MMTALLRDLTPGEAVLWDAMLAAGWTPAQCRMAFAAAARGVVVEARSALWRWDIDRYHARHDRLKEARQRDLVLRQLGTEAAKLASVTHASDRLLRGDVVEARLLVVPEVLTSSLD